MTNFIPTAALISPPQLLLPRAARHVISLPPSPPTHMPLLQPPKPQTRGQNQHRLLPCEGETTTPSNGHEETRAAGKQAADLQENKSHASAIWFVFLQ